MKKSILTIFLMAYALTGLADALSAFVEQLKPIKTLASQFEQIMQDKHGGELSRASGQLYIKRPNQFKWVITEPYKQQIISDGKTLWNFDEDLEQVSVSAFDKYLANSPLTFLLDPSEERLEGLFEIQMVKKANPTHYILMPKEADVDYTQIEVLFDESKLKEIRIDDQLGQKTIMQFSQYDVNDSLDKIKFSFKAPKGVEVIQE